MAHMVWVCVSSTQWLVISAAPAVRKVCASKKVQELGYIWFRAWGLRHIWFGAWGLGFLCWGRNKMSTFPDMGSHDSHHRDSRCV